MLRELSIPIVQQLASYIFLNAFVLLLDSLLISPSA